MGTRKTTNDGNLTSVVIPCTSDVWSRALKMLDADRITVNCEDGKERLCMARGKPNRLIYPWNFQTETHGDIFWRYHKVQSNWLRNHYFQTM